MDFKKCFVIVIMALSSLSSAAEGFVDLSVDKMRGHKAVGSVAAWSEFQGGAFEASMFADTGHYAEMFVGKSFKLNNLSFAPYIGIEKDADTRARIRGALWVNYDLTDHLASEGMFEFAGSTGRWHRVQLHYTHGAIKYSFVNESELGNGVRVQYKMNDTISPYVRVFKKNFTVGVVKTF